MTYEMYRYVFLGGAALAAVMLLVSVILFFALKIPKVISDLSGRTARRAIDDIRRQNEQSGDKSYKSSVVNAQRGKLTDKISKSGRLIKREANPFSTGVVTEKISTQRLPADAPAEETSVLSQGNETAVLDSGYGETAVLDSGYGETAVLDSGYGETSVLQPAMEAQQPAGADNFTVEYEITFIHTNEYIT